MNTVSRTGIIRRIYTSAKRLTRAMPKIAVRLADGEDRLQMSLWYGVVPTSQRQFNMDRLREEKLGVTLERMANNLMKKTKKKKKSKTDSEDEIIKINLLKNGELVDREIINGEAWESATELVIGDQTYEVNINLPIIKSVNLPERNIMSGFTIYPRCIQEFSNPDQLECTWYKEKLMKQQEVSSMESTSKGKKAENKDIEWIEIGKEFHYIPKNEDIGSLIKVEMTPVNGERRGDKVECVTKVPVTAGPGICPFDNRHIYTPIPSDGSTLRVVSYNILADYYADSDFSRTVLYPYCPPYALDIDYRIQLIIKEITGYNADVICLQEVDRKIFENQLKPALSREGFDGHLTEKDGQCPEGSANFYRRSKLRLIGEHDVVLREEIGNFPQLENLHKRICQNEVVKERLEKRNTALQVLVFESVTQPGRRVCVCNTHLYFRPNADYMRLIQSLICVHYIEKILQQYSQNGSKPAVIFAGDLNSDPPSGSIVLISTGKISGDHSAWLSSGPEEYVGGEDLGHNLELVGASGTPEYTNYVANFHCTLDHIFIDKEQLTVTQVIPMPSHQEVIQYTALPNVVFPSDHIALVSDIQWNPQ